MPINASPISSTGCFRKYGPPVIWRRRQRHATPLANSRSTRSSTRAAQAVRDVHGVTPHARVRRRCPPVHVPGRRTIPPRSGVDARALRAPLCQRDARRRSRKMSCTRQSRAVSAWRPRPVWCTLAPALMRRDHVSDKTAPLAFDQGRRRDRRTSTPSGALPAICMAICCGYAQADRRPADPRLPERQFCRYSAALAL